MAATLGVPQIIHLHYIIGPWLRRMVIKRLRTADHVVAVSDYIRQQAIEHGVLPDHVTTIRNSIRRFEPRDPAAVEAVRRGEGISSDAFIYGMVGRLDPGKGHLDVLAAFDRLATDDPGIWLMIAGTGRHESRIRSAARRSAAADRIVFLGQRSDVPDILGSLDAFIHPASKDPCPLAVLEAMAAGLPIVAYADGGVPELIVNAESGLLAPRGDVIDLSGLMGLLPARPRVGELARGGGRRPSGDGVHAGARRSGVRRHRHVRCRDGSSMRAAALLLALAVLAACGGSDDDTSPSTGPSTSSAAPTQPGSTTAGGERCLVRLHGKSGTGADTVVEDGVTIISPTGNAEGWGGRQWLYFPEADYEAARTIVADAVAGCDQVILDGFSNGASFAAKLYCRGETFEGRLVGVVVDDPVTDEGVEGCATRPVRRPDALLDRRAGRPSPAGVGLRRGGLDVRGRSDDRHRCIRRGVGHRAPGEPVRRAPVVSGCARAHAVACMTLTCASRAAAQPRRSPRRA